MKPMTREPDPRANGISTNDYVASLPRRRYSHEAQGKVLLLPSSGLVVVPFDERPGGGWAVVVVEGFGSYKVGGYHLFVSRGEIETAIELSLGAEVPVHVIATAEEAEALEDGVLVLTRAHGWLTRGTVDGATMWSRKAFGKVSLRTDELADQFPLVVRDPLESPAAPLPVGHRYVNSPEEAEALPDHESILTPGGIVFRKRVGYYREGETAWCRFQHDPITTHLLDEKVHFPAKVLGTTDTDTPSWKK